MAKKSRGPSRKRQQPAEPTVSTQAPAMPAVDVPAAATEAKQPVSRQPEVRPDQKIEELISLAQGIGQTRISDLLRGLAITLPEIRMDKFKESSLLRAASSCEALANEVDDLARSEEKPSPQMKEIRKVLLEEAIRFRRDLIVYYEELTAPSTPDERTRNLELIAHRHEELARIGDKLDRPQMAEIQLLDAVDTWRKAIVRLARGGQMRQAYTLWARAEALMQDLCRRRGIEYEQTAVEQLVEKEREKESGEGPS